PLEPRAAHARLPGLLRKAHLAEFGHAPDVDARIEIVNLRVACLGALDSPELEVVPETEPAMPLEQRIVSFGEERFTTPVYSRERLGRATRLSGPAIVEQMDSTTIVPPRWAAEVDGFGNLLLQPD